jgi:CRP/FNR family cyclic AMP-dependent transcriptional regulator
LSLRRTGVEPASNHRAHAVVEAKPWEGSMGTTRIRNLAQLDLFRGCGSRQLRGIDSLCTEVAVRPGRVLCAEGDIGREFFVLLDGGVTVSRDGDALAYLGAGDWFGEIALISWHRRRTATVVTTEASRALVFGGREFRSMVGTCPLVGRKLKVSSVWRTTTYPQACRERMDPVLSGAST